MRRFGLHFGMTYQLVDDWLDYAGDTSTMGKNVGDDLAEGKLTLPLIYALGGGSESDKNIIRQAIEKKNTKHLRRIIDIVQACGALDYTHKAAAAEADLALACLDDIEPGPYVDALCTVTRYSTARLF
jgi:octaprenyl-diphosphate synthase